MPLHSLPCESGRRDDLNDRLRQVAAHLVSRINYVAATGPEDALPLHVSYDRDLHALDAALSCLVAGDAQGAIVALTDAKAGLQGAKYALDVSYPVYHRHSVGSRNPGRNDLFWGQDRTPLITDVWMELHSLQDKQARGMADFGAEKHLLKDKREIIAAAYRDALRELTDAIYQATSLLPTN